MTRFKLVAYTVRIREKRSQEYLTLGDIDRKSLSFSTLVKKILESLDKAKVYKDLEKTISIENLDFGNESLQGIIRSGEYGFAADFYDTKKGEYMDYRRETVHSEVLPFYFHIYLPHDKKMGFAIFQTFKAFGIKSLIHKVIREDKKLADYSVDILPFISENIMKLIEENTLVELKLLRHDVPKDVAERVHDGKADEIYEERIFKAKAKKKLKIPDRLKALLSNKEPKFFEVLEEKYEQVKATVKVGKSRVTVTFSERDKFNEFLALDGKMQLKDGFPTYEYLKEKSSEYLKYLLKISGAS